MNRGFRQALIVSAIAALLAGCGGQIANVRAPNAQAQARVHRGSGSTGDLIYATGGCGGVCVMSYPGGALIGEISLSGPVGGACSDATGNVFVTDDNQVLEYAHGGTWPIASLSLPGKTATGCSIDPLTHNLAVVFRGSGVNVAIFSNGEGSPTVYSTHVSSFYCGYDNASNLFASGSTGSSPHLTELANGGADFFVLSTKGKLGNPGQVQWDGQYLAYESNSPGNIRLFRVTVSGSKATVTGTTKFSGGLQNANQSWIYGDAVLVPYASRGQSVNKLGVWPYPGGKKATAKFKLPKSKFWIFKGITVSIAPSR